MDMAILMVDMPVGGLTLELLTLRHPVNLQRTRHSNVKD